MKILQLLARVAACADGLEPFKGDEVEIEIPEADRENSIKSAAKLIVALSAAPIWESLYCTVADKRDIQLLICVDSITLRATYKVTVISDYGPLPSWYSDKTELVRLLKADMREGMADLLSDMAAIHFDGAPIERGWDYVITPRD